MRKPITGGAVAVLAEFLGTKLDETGIKAVLHKWRARVLFAPALIVRIKARAVFGIIAAIGLKPIADAVVLARRQPISRVDQGSRF